MKKIFFSLILSIFGLISFSNAQFIEESSGNGCTNSNYCSTDGLSKLVVDVPNGSRNIYLYVKCGGWKAYNGDSLNQGQVYNFDNPSSFFSNYCQGQGLSYDGLFFVYGSSPYTVKLIRSSSSMPVSQLTPVITGISTVVGEFIPYVIYISLGVLIGTLGFVAIKRLMLRIYNKVKFIFKKR